METRLKNADRPKEEQWLIDTIIEHDIEGAESVIDIIKRKIFNTNSTSSIPNFSHLDEDGNSFLFLSIANQIKPITAILYELLKDNDAVIVAKNNKNQTLLWQLAQNQDKEMLEVILPKIILYYKRNLLQERLWFLRDNDGNTPLHVAITPEKIDCLSYLLNTIQSIEDKKSIAFQLNNLTNKNGNTPLHIACKMKNIYAIALLTKYGADWTVVNDKKKSAFDYFCKLEIESQLKLITLLAIQNKQIIDRTYQYYLLNIYQKHLLSNNAKTCKENYCKLAGLVSLKSLIIANMATNISIKKALITDPTAHPYFAHENEIEIEIETNEKTENSIKNNIENKMENKIQNKIQNNDDIIIDIDHDNNISSLEQKNFDRAKFTDFINEVDAYILTLENNHRPSILPKLVLTLIIINWLLFWGIEGWLIHEKLQSQDLTNCKIISSDAQYHPDNFCGDDKHPASLRNQSKADTQLFLVSFIYGVLSSLISIIPCKIWNQEELMRKKEWKKKMAFLDEILVNLKKFPHEQLPSDHNDAIEQLQAAKNALEDYQPKIEVINIFKCISLNLKKIRTDFNLGFYANNLTLFKQDKSSVNALQSLPNNISMPENNSTQNSIDNSIEDNIPLLIIRN